MNKQHRIKEDTMDLMRQQKNLNTLSTLSTLIQAGPDIKALIRMRGKSDFIQRLIFDPLKSPTKKPH